MSKFINIEEQPQDINKKTKTFIVNSVSVPSVKLGEIKWFGAWRKYCFFPENATVFDSVCLENIQDYIDGLMLERKIGQELKKEETDKIWKSDNNGNNY